MLFVLANKYYDLVNYVGFQLDYYGVPKREDKRVKVIVFCHPESNRKNGREELSPTGLAQVARIVEQLQLRFGSLSTPPIVTKSVFRRTELLADEIAGAFNVHATTAPWLYAGPVGLLFPNCRGHDLVILVANPYFLGNMLDLAGYCECAEIADGEGFEFEVNAEACTLSVEKLPSL